MLAESTQASHSLAELFVVDIGRPRRSTTMAATSQISSSAMLVTAMLSASTALAQTPIREGYIKADKGVQLYYRVLGSGSAPIVLLHGGPGLTSDYLADDLVTMARNHSLFVYDQRGIGRSTLVTDSPALAAQRYVE